MAGTAAVFWSWSSPLILSCDAKLIQKQIHQNGKVSRETLNTIVESAPGIVFKMYSDQLTTQLNSCSNTSKTKLISETGATTSS